MERIVIHEKVAPAETVLTGINGMYKKAPYRIPTSGFYEFVEYAYRSNGVLIHDSYSFEEKKIKYTEKEKRTYYKFVDGKKGNFIIEVTESEKYIIEYTGYYIGTRKPKKQRINRESLATLLEKNEVNYCGE